MCVNLREIGLPSPRNLFRSFEIHCMYILMLIGKSILAYMNFIKEYYLGARKRPSESTHEYDMCKT